MSNIRKVKIPDDIWFWRVPNFLSKKKVYDVTTSDFRRLYLKHNLEGFLDRTLWEKK